MPGNLSGIARRLPQQRPGRPSAAARWHVRHVSASGLYLGHTNHALAHQGHLSVQEPGAAASVAAASFAAASFAVATATHAATAVASAQDVRGHGRGRHVRVARRVHHRIGHRVHRLYWRQWQQLPASGAN